MYIQWTDKIAYNTHHNGRFLFMFKSNMSRETMYFDRSHKIYLMTVTQTIVAPRKHSFSNIVYAWCPILCISKKIIALQFIKNSTTSNSFRTCYLPSVEANSILSLKRLRGRLAQSIKYTKKTFKYSITIYKTKH